MSTYSAILTFILTVFLISTEGKIDTLSNKCTDLDPGILGWAGYIDKWKAHDRLKSDRMYPYGPAYCDVRDTSSASITIQGDVLFYAVQYESIILTIHGHISFSSPDRPLPPTSGEWNNPKPWPNSYYGARLEEKDPAMAAIFYTTHEVKRQGALNYRTLIRNGNNGPVNLIQDGMLDLLSADIQDAVVGAAKFVATYGVVVTWERMTFSGVDCTADYVNDNCPRNTYQMALVTDGKDTFVIYNYYNVTWAGTTSMGCDSKTGRPSDATPNCKGAQIGFNVGDGRYFWSFPYSLSTKVVDLDQEYMKGSIVRGRYFFKVSDAFIQRGGCTTDTDLPGEKWPLTIGPTTGSMLGGYDMNISAPCFVGGERIQCKFGESLVTEGFFEQNAMMARCPVPIMSSVGRVKVGVSNDGGSNFKFSTYLTVGMPGYVPHGVTVENLANEWLNVEKFDIRWDPYGISWRTVDFVDIKLYGYKESAVTDGTTWKLLHTLATDVKNDGYYTIHPSQHQCGGLDAEVNCVEFTVGLLGVQVSGTNPGASPTALWSDPLPVGWFIKTEARKHLGHDWVHELCRRWYSDDVRVEQWDRDLPPCPCTLSQAYQDWGRFTDDVECSNRQTSSDNINKCQRHKGAQHCLRSNVPTSTGAGAQCCYDSSGDLMYSVDTQYGSTPDRAHAWGTRPYGGSGRVPLLSHWYWDIAPYYACCEWQNAGPDCFNYYINRRNTPSCQAYRLPGRAAAFGDPHIRTFDGLTYTYNGKGEYTLLTANKVMVAGKDISFTLQARYQQPQAQPWGVAKGTVITAVAMQTRVGAVEGETVEIQRNNYKPGDRRLLVYVNQALIDFRDPRMWRQDFNDLIIFNNDPASAKHHTNFTVIFRDSQVGVQVAYTAGFMQVITVVPPEMEGKTTGLFGIWDGNPDNDIQRKDGGNPVPADETKRIHDVVGGTWQISEAESLMTYWAKVDNDYYKDPSFIPEFVPKFPPNNIKVTPGQVDQLCGSNVHCQFDYMVTLDAAVAQNTLDVQAWLQQQTDESITVVSCGLLDIPNSVKSGGKGYPGSQVTISGCRHDYTLEGPTRYDCVKEGASANWRPAVTTRCIDPASAKQAEAQMAMVIGVPVGIVFLLIVIGIVGLLCYLRQKRIDRGPKAPPGDDLEHIPVSQFHASDIRAEDYIVNDKPPTKKKPRPARPNNQLPASRSHDDLSLYGSQRNNNFSRDRGLSASADALDRDASLSTKGSSLYDDVDLNNSLQSETSRRGPRPYNYPRNTETVGERRRAPYAYPRNTETILTPEQRALIEQRTREVNNPEP